MPLFTIRSALFYPRSISSFFIIHPFLLSTFTGMDIVPANLVDSQKLFIFKKILTLTYFRFAAEHCRTVGCYGHSAAFGIVTTSYGE